MLIINDCCSGNSNASFLDGLKGKSPVDEHRHGAFQKPAVQKTARLSQEAAARMGSGVVDRFLHAAQVLEGEHGLKVKAVQAADTEKELSKLERIRAKNRKVCLGMFAA